MTRHGAMRQAVFIDKDGTLVENIPYNVDPALLRFTPHAVTALKRLAGAGYVLIVVSNQPGVALKHFSVAALHELGRALIGRLADAGVPLAGCYFCPHAPAGDRLGGRCRCRKPAPGLLLHAARAHGIDLDRSWMVGDILDDVEAGWRAGCGSVLLDAGNETEWRWSPIRIPHFRVRDLRGAAESIIGARASGRPQVLQRRPTVRRPSHAAARDAWAG